MQTIRPFVLIIAGLDPSGGAGVLADVKTLEQHRVYGLAIVTGNTIQTEDAFFEIEWISIDFLLQSIGVLFKKYDIKTVKIGIVPTLEYLSILILEIKKHNPNTKIIWDTVLESSSKFDFMAIKNEDKLALILEKIDLITPNYNEILDLTPAENDIETIAKTLSKFCAVLLKGGHNAKAIGTDVLYEKGEITIIKATKKGLYEKHGSGCVLSSAITANIALGDNLKTACKKAKIYIEQFLNSNQTLLGYHHD